MARRPLKNGFSVVEIIIVVAIVAIIGALGVAGYNQWQAANTGSNATGIAETKDTSGDIAVPTVNDAKDLDTVTKALDDINLTEDSSDLDEIDAEAAGF